MCRALTTFKLEGEVTSLSELTGRSGATSRRS